MRIIPVAIMWLLLLAGPSHAGEVVKFVFDVQPGSLLFSPKVDSFKTYSYYRSEKINGTGSYMPNARLGIGIDTGAMNLDVTAGPGFLWNNAFYASFARGDVACRFKLGEAITLGPHAGVVFFDAPHWSGEAKLDFSSTTGFMGGLDFTAGRKISFLASLDYVNARFNVRSTPGWLVNDDTLDMSGIAILLGIVGRF